MVASMEMAVVVLSNRVLMPVPSRMGRTTSPLPGGAGAKPASPPSP